MQSKAKAICMAGFVRHHCSEWHSVPVSDQKYEGNVVAEGCSESLSPMDAYAVGPL